MREGLDEGGGFGRGEGKERKGEGFEEGELLSYVLFEGLFENVGCCCEEGGVCFVVFAILIPFAAFSPLL